MGIPSRGEIWTVNLNPVKGHEQAGFRPGLVISVDTFNHGPAGLVVIIPITTKEKRIPFHVGVNPSEAGVSKKSFIKCEDVRSVSTERLSKCLGKVSPETLRAIEDRLKILLDLS
ncbi:MAG: Endoribonuclease MazF9 [candidate division WS2 bacterium]|uniref:mRNA interferase n=1 Tax=Psychracetigena formicireducens TaxID=2986056 RepID=A0A9E2F1Q7_PSYF1|nr:Endoribonuclease MazF9 [Candidatus Psychracetigena formicireducens]